jgi:hypothetical protein
VFITAVPNTKLFAWGEEDSGLAISGVPGSKGVCVFITAGPSTKMFTWGWDP